MRYAVAVALLVRAAAVAMALLVHAAAGGSDECVVSRRLPPFGLRTKRKASRDAVRPPEPASRQPGGVCHMGRLAQLTGGDATSGAPESLQLCTRDSTGVTCSVLQQNQSHPNSSSPRLHVFEASTPGDGEQDVRELHARRTLCSACDRQDVEAVLTRFMRTRQTSSRRQLSVGLPQRLSTARLLAAHLHRAVCNSSATCPALDEALAGACDGDCMRRDSFRAALLNRTHFAARAVKTASDASDALWQRSWVYCPLSREGTADFAQCHGSVDKATWLNVSTRAQACAASIPQMSTSTMNVDFCLLHANTSRLCEKMVQWRREAQSIICRASGRCPTTNFFYSPTSFDLREKQFVYDSVLDFYTRDAQRSCPPSTSVNVQQLSNEASMQRCASVSIEPMLTIVEQLREGKRLLLLVGYHYYRVQWYLVQLLVAATVDTAASAARASTDTLGRVADSLLREIMALMEVIGNFVDQLGDSIMELAMSRGVGKTFKDLVVFLCQVIEVVHNTLWVHVLCPLLQLAMSAAEFMIDVLDTLLDIVRILSMGAASAALDLFIAVCRQVIRGVTRALGDCESRQFNCVLEPVFGTQDSDVGALPMPTRCWASYLTFFGDQQQLSCTKADTCKLAPLAAISERRVCAACPEQTNPSVQDFACHALTGICTCGVPRMSSTSCFTNDDCTLDPEASCRLINEDLEISKSSVACAQCEYQRMCYETREGGVCACGARHRPFHSCSREDQQQSRALSLRLNDLCLYTPIEGVIEFGLSSVIPCQELDSSTSSCAYASDINAYMARGFSRVRRRLLQTPSPPTTYQSEDSVCRDALASEALPFTRLSCQKAFDASNATLVLLGLDRQLPPCALCSYADALDAARQNPLAALHLMSPHMLIIVLRRHGPFGQLAQLSSVVRSGVRDVSALLSRNGRENASRAVAIERRAGAFLVRVGHAAVPPHVARALEHLLENLLPQLERVLPLNDSGGHNASAAADSTDTAPARRLLYLRELIHAVEQRVKSGWSESGRLHQSFSQSMSQMLTYDDVHNYETAMPGQEWPPTRSAGTPPCTELIDLLAIFVDMAKGVFDGWLTLTHMRDELQARPADSLSDAWPVLLRAERELDPPDENLAIQSPEEDDLVTHLCAEGTAAAFEALRIQPRMVYDVLYSVASAANASFSCPYHAVQTCSGWSRRMWQALVIAALYFSAIVFVVNALGVSYASFLLVPLFGIVLFQLAYGYTWTCAPMVPVCALQDFAESIDTLLPLSLEIPDELKRLDPHCLQTCGPDCVALQRYPPPSCLKSCRDPPFVFVSVRDVVAWFLAEAGAADFAEANAHRVPLLDHEAFVQQLRQRTRTLRRASTDSVRAHRVCALLSAYMLLPYVFILLLLLAFLASLAQALATQLLPIFLLVCALFTAVAASANTQDEERLAALEKTMQELQKEDEDDSQTQK